MGAVLDRPDHGAEFFRKGSCRTAPIACATLPPLAELVESPTARPDSFGTRMARQLIWLKCVVNEDNHQLACRQALDFRAATRRESRHPAKEGRNPVRRGSE